MPYIGPDTIELLIREPAAGVDQHGRPNYTERVVPVTNSSLTVTAVSETRDTGRFIVYQAKAMLPPDNLDAASLKNTDAIRDASAPERAYELTGDAIMKTTLRGRPDHIRVYAILEQPVGVVDGTREQVTITPDGGRDDSGQPLPDGAPFTVLARGVMAGNPSQTVDERGTLIAADFTVDLDLDVPVRNGDRMSVRGMSGVVTVADRLGATDDASVRRVFVRSRTGGRR